jgi:hypothetical protein
MPLYRPPFNGPILEELELLPMDPPRSWPLPPGPVPPLPIRWVVDILAPPAEWSAPAADLGDYHKVIGGWMRCHWRALARLNGIGPTARRLRKQGVPVEVAVLLLALRP